MLKDYSNILSEYLSHNVYILIYINGTNIVMYYEVHKNVFSNQYNIYDWF